MGLFFFSQQHFLPHLHWKENVFPSHGTACWPGHPLCALGSWVPQGANKKGLEGGLCFLALGPQSGEENERKQPVSSFGDTSSRSSWGHTALSNMPPGDGCEVSETAPGLGSARKQPIPQATPPTSQPPQANPPKPTPLLPGSWNLLPRHEFQMNRGSHTGDRLSRLSGCAAHFLLLRVADASLSRCLGGRAGKAPPHVPTHRGAALASEDILGSVPGRCVTCFTQDPPDAKDARPCHMGKPLLALCANGQPPACWAGRRWGGHGDASSSEPGPPGERPRHRAGI